MLAAMQIKIHPANRTEREFLLLPISHIISHKKIVGGGDSRKKFLFASTQNRMK